PQGLGRDWFAAQVQKVGGQTEFVVAYQRQIPRWNEGQRALAKAAASNGSIWLFSSSEAVANLGACLAGQDWGQACAIATHARVALAARHAGFGSVRESRPVLADILASIESFQ
ncbi:MAG: uroporphyrinogen-III synthase, partial [Hylemonella sp.]